MWTWQCAGGCGAARGWWEVGPTWGETQLTTVLSGCRQKTCNIRKQTNQKHISHILDSCISKMASYDTPIFSKDLIVNFLYNVHITFNTINYTLTWTPTEGAVQG